MIISTPLWACKRVKRSDTKLWVSQGSSQNQGDTLQLPAATDFQHGSCPETGSYWYRMPTKCKGSRGNDDRFWEILEYPVDIFAQTQIGHDRHDNYHLSAWIQHLILQVEGILEFSVRSNLRNLAPKRPQKGLRDLSGDVMVIWMVPYGARICQNLLEPSNSMVSARSVELILNQSTWGTSSFCYAVFSPSRRVQKHPAGSAISVVSKLVSYIPPWNIPKTY